MVIKYWQIFVIICRVSTDVILTEIQHHQYILLFNAIFKNMDRKGICEIAISYLIQVILEW